jgi:hypothetical protein
LASPTRRVPSDPPAETAPAPTAVRRLTSWLERPQPVVRLEVLRIFGPLAVLGFMSDRLAHADEWIGRTGFRIRDFGGDWRSITFVRGLPGSLAWWIAGAMILSGLATSAGFKTRWSALVFAGTLIFVGMSDHLSSFTVTKIGPVLMIVVATAPAGRRLGIDAWRKRALGGKRPKRLRPLPTVRFLQLFLAVFYCASGVAKARGDWLKVPLVMWSHLHDSYQTGFTFALAQVLPAWMWTALQALVLTFELFAPLWFGLSWTRTLAFVFAVGMHVGIGVMFGPVVWFAMLMITVLVAAYLPERMLSPLEALAERFERQRYQPSASHSSRR